MTGTNCDLFTHKSDRSYLNHLVDIFQNRLQMKTNKMHKLCIFPQFVAPTYFCRA